jgi:hypothetical protein
VANGIEQDIREIRADIKSIAEKGCAHKDGQDGSIKDLWLAVKSESKERVAMFTKFVLLILTIVVAGVFSSYYVTSSAVEAAVTKALAVQAATVQKR